MRKGIQDDLRQRLIEAHGEGHCLVATSPSDSRRLRKALQRGDLVSPARGVFALPEIWSELKPRPREWQKLQALAILHPDWVFAHASAAVLHGLYVSNRLLGPVHIAIGRNSWSRSTVSVVRHIVENDVPVCIGHAMTTSLTRTTFDCLRTYDFRCALAIADSTLRFGSIEQNALADAFDTFDGRHAGAWRATQIAKWANPLSENGGESIARAVMIEEGFRMPELQVAIPSPTNPDDTYRVDFFWSLSSGNVAGELDGREKYRNPAMTGGRDAVDVLADERLRESRLTGANTKVLRFSFAEVMNVGLFRHLLLSFGVPDGYAVPDVALHRGSR